jgi:hypothetical protein
MLFDGSKLKFLAAFVVVVAIATSTVGQNPQSAPYTPAVPPPSMGMYGGGGYGYGGGAGTTVAGSAMTGMASVVSAKGDYNLSTSAAAVNMTQAQKAEIQNRQLYTNTYFEMRETNRKARAAENATPRHSAEQLARIARETAPKPLSPGDMNDVTGKLVWPDILQTDAFASDRKKLEHLFGSYSQLGNLNYADQVETRKIITDMAKQLKTNIRSMPASHYTECKNFLKSLLFTTCKCQLG